MTFWYQREERASLDHFSAATISQVALRIIWKKKKKSREETKAVCKGPYSESSWVPGGGGVLWAETIYFQAKAAACVIAGSLCHDQYKALQY